MAIEKTIKINVDTGKSEAELDNFKKSLKEVDKTAEQTSKSVDDVASNGGAIAILDQLTGGLATRIRDAYEASKLFNVSLKATRGALLATGIGALVVAVGLLITYWDDIVELVKDTNGQLQRQLDLSIKAQETTKLRISLLDKQITLNEKLGKGNEELQKQRIELVRILREQNDEELNTLTLQNEKLKTSALELSTREKILKTVLNTVSAGSGDAFILDKQQEALEKYKETQDLILKARGEQIDLDVKIFDLESPEDKDSNGDKREKIESVGGIDTAEQQQAQRDKDAEFFEETLELEKFREEQLTNIKIDAELKRSVNAAKESQKRIDIANDEAKNKEDREKLLEDTKVSLAENGFNLLGNLAKKGSELAKGIAIAGIVREQVKSVSDTVQSTVAANAKAAAASPLTAGQPFVAINTIQAGLGIASGISQAAKSIKSITGGGTSPVGGNVSGGGGGTPAPSFNLVQGTGSNQIAESLQTGQEPVKAFVVSSEVTTNQSLDRNIEENASL